MLSFLLLFTIAAGAAQVDLLGRMEELAQTALPAKEREIQDFVDRVQKLQPLYQDPDRFDDTRGQRSRLLTLGWPRFDAYAALHIEFQKAETVMQAQVGLAAIGSRLRGQGVGGDSTQTLFRLKLAHEAYRSSADRVSRLEAKMREDEKLFAQAEGVYKRRLLRASRIRWSLWISLSIILFVVTAVTLAQRMAAKTVRRALAIEPKQDSRVLAGNIRLERIIGEGGMGVVYEGTDLTLDRKVAVKQMRDEVSGDPRGLPQFLAEARMVAALKHPNIVEIYSILKEQGKLYLVFEHVEGETLHHALQVNKKLTLEQSLSVLRQAASALDYAHSKKVIHRDLKPSNIMLTPAGVARLMDFGIAYQAKKTIAMLTKAEKWGTPAFMSPEQELGEIGRESDIFALGVCFYAMLTGTLPFPGPDFLAQKRAMNLARAELLPKGLLPVMAKAFAIDARQRYHTGAELLAAVRDA